jgi:hypothetical protein
VKRIGMFLAGVVVGVFIRLVWEGRKDTMWADYEIRTTRPGD